MTRQTEVLVGLVLFLAAWVRPAGAQTRQPPDLLRSENARMFDARSAGPSGRAEVTSSPDSRTVSADLLRHPISKKARQMLQTALQTMNSGDHPAAIAQLLDTLAKYPDSAAFAYSLLGVEYVRTDRYTDAVD